MKNNGKLPDKWYIRGCEELKKYLRFTNSYTGDNPNNAYFTDDDGIWDFVSINLIVTKGWQGISLQQYIESLEPNKNNTTMQTIEIPQGFQLNLDKLKELGIIIPVKDEPKKLSYDEIIDHIPGYAHNLVIGDNLVPNIKALIMLANTAKFLNGKDFNPKEGDVHYFIYLENDNVIIDSANINAFDGSILFKTKELAQQALDILGEETIKLALKLN